MNACDFFSNLMETPISSGCTVVIIFINLTGRVVNFSIILTGRQWIDSGNYANLRLNRLG